MPRMMESNETLEAALARNVRDALSEDIGLCDWTARLVPEGRRALARVTAKEAAGALSTIFGFVNHHRIWRINYSIGHDHISTNRQTVHKNSVVCFRHFCFVNDPVLA